MDWQNMTVKEVQDQAGKMAAQVTMFLKQPRPDVTKAVTVYKELVLGLNMLKNAPVISQKAKMSSVPQASKFTTSMPGNARGVQEQTSTDPGTQKMNLLKKIVEQTHFELKQHKADV
jgi:hypothetical protein